MRFSDWLRKGTQRKTTSLRRAASALTAPSTVAPPHQRAHARGRLAGAVGVARADDHRRALLGQARGKPEAERAGAPDDGDGIHGGGL